MALPVLSADLQTYARILARLAHRFADRSAVLEIRGLDEMGFDALERRAMSYLSAATSRGDATLSAAFASELLAARRALTVVDVDPPTAGPATIERADNSPLTVLTPTPHDPLFDATATEQDDGEEEVDVLDLMETLHSSAAGNRPPTST